MCYFNASPPPPAQNRRQAGDLSRRDSVLSFVSLAVKKHRKRDSERVEASAKCVCVNPLRSNQGYWDACHQDVERKAAWREREAHEWTMLLTSLHSKTAFCAALCPNLRRLHNSVLHPQSTNTTSWHTWIQKQFLIFVPSWFRKSLYR